ncbi:glycosyl transferase family 1 [Nitrospira sp.]|nr:glycosyl transferase family 1 [Nitrospira sp.]
MRIVIDVTALLPCMTGIDTYLMQLVTHLVKGNPEHDYLLCHNYEDRRLFAGNLSQPTLRLAVSTRHRPVRLFSQQCLLPAAAVAWRADVVHSPSFIMPCIRGSARHVLTVHDMTSFSHPQCHIALRRSGLYKRMVLASLRRAHAVIVPSQATRQAILEVFTNIPPERIHVTPYGIGEEFKPYNHAEIRDILTRLKLPQPYILYLGTIEPRKNLSTLVESYRRLVLSGAIKEHLVLAGRLGWNYHSLLEQIDDPALCGRVHLVGYIDQEALPALYAGARLFVYPSLYEGFGFPPLEAMACGVPVISARNSSLVENLEGAAELVDSGDIVGLSHAMRCVLTDDDMRAMLRTRGLERASHYRWDRTAKETVKVYQSAMTVPAENRY